MSVPELAIVLGWDRAHVEGQELLDSGVNTDITESAADAKEANGIPCNKKKHPLFCLEKLLQVGIILLICMFLTLSTQLYMDM